jgi:hypothetical protein
MTLNNVCVFCKGDIHILVSRARLLGVMVMSMSTYWSHRASVVLMCNRALGSL